jgi:transcriptional regulator with XRE-family HTH domain
MTIGEKIRALRQAQNLKQKELAEKINVSATALMFAEKGIRQPSKDLVMRLSRFFNKPADYFLFEETPDILDRPVTNISPETLVDILYTIEEFLSENHLSMSSDQQKQLLKHFYNSGCHDASRIKEMLSTLQAVNSDMFTKGK